MSEREGRREVWALSDGRAGHAGQARALADAISARVGAATVEKLVEPRAPLGRVPAALWAALPPRSGGWPFTGLRDGATRFAPPWPLMAVGAGRKAAPIVAALGRVGGARTVQILRPGMALAAFDLVVAPRHDALSGPNVVETVGALSPVTRAAAEAAADPWRRSLGHLPTPRVAVMVGGPSRSAAFGAKALAALCDGLARLAVDGVGLIVIPSPRTPKGVVDRLAETLSPLGGAWVWPRVGANPYPGALALVDAAVVTADSVSMTSEAAAAGLPVLVSPVDRLDEKFRRFHAAMEEAGAARPFAGTLDLWPVEALDETRRVADRAAALLEPAAETDPAEARGDQ